MASGCPTCPICLEPLGRGDTAVLHPCAHTCHNACARRYVNQVGFRKCFLCRRPLERVVMSTGATVQPPEPPRPCRRARSGPPGRGRPAAPASVPARWRQFIDDDTPTVPICRKAAGAPRVRRRSYGFEERHDDDNPYLDALGL